MAKCARVNCPHDVGASKRQKRFCCNNCRVIDNRMKRDAVTRPLRAVSALLEVRMTVQQALDIVDRQGMKKVTYWLSLFGFQWANGRWAVQT